MDIGTGIAIGATIIGGAGVTLRLLAAKSSYVEEKIFDLRKEHVNEQMRFLAQNINGGFTKLDNSLNSLRKEIKSDIQNIHTRIDDVLKAK